MEKYTEIDKQYNLSTSEKIGFFLTGALIGTILFEIVNNLIL